MGALRGAAAIRAGDAWTAGPSSLGREAAIEAGIGLVTEDRHGTGLFHLLNVAQNIGVATLDRLRYLGRISGAAEVRVADEQVRALRIRTVVLARADHEPVGRQPAEDAARPLARARRAGAAPRRAGARASTSGRATRSTASCACSRASAAARSSSRAPSRPSSSGPATATSSCATGGSSRDVPAAETDEERLLAVASAAEPSARARRARDATSHGRDATVSRRTARDLEGRVAIVTGGARASGGRSHAVPRAGRDGRHRRPRPGGAPRRRPPSSRRSARSARWPST